MSKNTILNNAIGAVLALPRQALWTTTIAVAAFSLEAAVSVIGENSTFTIGTPTAQATEGGLVNDCTPTAVVIGTGIGTTFTSGGDAGTGLSTMLNKGDPAQTGSCSDDGDNKDKITTYASEIFQAGTPASGVPSTATDYHVIKYTWSGGSSNSTTANTYIPGDTAAKGLKITVNLPNGGQLDKMMARLDSSLQINPCTVSVSSPTITITSPAGTPCTLADSSEIYVAFKLKGITASSQKDSLVKVEMSLKDTTSFPPNPTRSVNVAQLKPGLTVSILPESGGFIYTSSAAEDKEFIATGTTDAYVSQNEARIGYVQFKTNEGVLAADAKTLFKPGQVGDVGTLTITNGQFAASKGDANGKAFILAGSEIGADVVTPAVDDTKTWTLTAAHLNSIANYTNESDNILGKAPIHIRLDGTTPVNPIDGDPVGTIEIKLGSLNPAPTIKTPDCATCTSPLLRIPSDGKTCWIHNIPDVGVLDAFSLRITNNHPTMPAKIIGTMYHEDGTSDDFTSVIVAEAIAPRATIRLGTEDLVKLGTSVTWKDSQFQGKERRIMKLVSTVPDIEVFNLIRGSKDGSQPMVNVSTGVRGFDCYPR